MKCPQNISVKKKRQKRPIVLKKAGRMQKCSSTSSRCKIFRYKTDIAVSHSSLVSACNEQDDKFLA